MINVLYMNIVYYEKANMSSMKHETIVTGNVYIIMTFISEACYSYPQNCSARNIFTCIFLEIMRHISFRKYKICGLYACKQCYFVNFDFISCAYINEVIQTVPVHRTSKTFLFSGCLLYFTDQENHSYKCNKYTA